MRAKEGIGVFLEKRKQVLVRPLSRGPTVDKYQP